MSSPAEKPSGTTNNVSKIVIFSPSTSMGQETMRISMLKKFWISMSIGRPQRFQP